MYSGRTAILGLEEEQEGYRNPRSNEERAGGVGGRAERSLAECEQLLRRTALRTIIVAEDDKLDASGSMTTATRPGGYKRRTAGRSCILCVEERLSLPAPPTPCAGVLLHELLAHVVAFNIFCVEWYGWMEEGEEEEDGERWRRKTADWGCRVAGTCATVVRVARGRGAYWVVVRDSVYAERRTLGGRRASLAARSQDQAPGVSRIGVRPLVW